MEARVEGVFLARGPCSVRVVEGSLEVLGGLLREGGFIIVPAGRVVPLRSSGAGVEVSGCSLERARAESYESFESLASQVRGRRRVVLVGPTDSGKSTLAAWILNSWGGSGHLLESDIGQNEIFAPGFQALAGLGGPVAVPGLVESFSEIKPCFVGSFTPSSAESKYLACAARLAREAGGRLVVDTDGWVQPWGGLYSKAAIALSVGADSIVALGLGERLSRVIEDLTGIEVLRAPRLASSGKSREERALHRDRLLSRRLVGARERSLSVDKIEIVGAPLFHGQPLNPQALSEIDENAVYGEAQATGVAVVVKSHTYKRKPGVRYIKAGWERGLLAAVHSGGLIEVGVVTKVDYRSRRIIVATRIEGDIDKVEVGAARVDYESLAGKLVW